MLKVEKRHTSKCVSNRRKKDPGASEYDDYARCTCGYRAIGMLRSAFIRKSLKTSTYETAMKTLLEWEAGESAKDQAPVTVEAAVKAYLDDAKARNLQE